MFKALDAFLHTADVLISPIQVIWRSVPWSSHLNSYVGAKSFEFCAPIFTVFKVLPTWMLFLFTFCHVRGVKFCFLYNPTNPLIGRVFWKNQAIREYFCGCEMLNSFLTFHLFQCLTLFTLKSVVFWLCIL